MLENVESEQSLVVSIHTIYSLKNFGQIFSTIGCRKKKQIENRKQINLLDCVILFLLLLYNSEECGNKKNPHGIENLCKSFNKGNSFLFDVDCHII